jgi:hypothetical protein
VKIISSILREQQLWSAQQRERDRREKSHGRWF